MIASKSSKNKKFPVILILSPSEHHLWAVILKCLPACIIHKFTTFLYYLCEILSIKAELTLPKRVSDNHTMIVSPNCGPLIMQNRKSLKCLTITLVMNFSQEFLKLHNSCFLTKFYDPLSLFHIVSCLFNCLQQPASNGAYHRCF